MDFFLPDFVKTCHLFKHFMFAIQADVNLTLFWSMILDCDKQWIVSEKFLYFASDEGVFLIFFVMLLLCFVFECLSYEICQSIRERFILCEYCM